MMRHKNKITCVLIRWLLFLALILAGCSTTSTTSTTTNTVLPEQAVAITLPGVPNLYRVSPVLYRSAQPTEAGFAELAKLGIKSVVNLRSESEDPKLDWAKQYWIKTRAFALTAEQIQEFLDIVSDPANQPVLVHCRYGADRTGAMVAAYRVRIQGWSNADAVKEMTGGYGFHRFYVNLPDLITTGIEIYTGIKGVGNSADSSASNSADGIVKTPATTATTTTAAPTTAASVTEASTATTASTITITIPTTTTTITTTTVPPTTTAPTAITPVVDALADDISPADITFINDPGGIGSWSRTCALHVYLSGGDIVYEQSGTSTWPEKQFQTVMVVANPWVVAKRDGKWYAFSTEWFARGGSSKPKSTICGLPGGAYHLFPVDWTPQPGETVGFFVASLSRGDMRSVNERTPIKLLIWK